MARTPRLSLIVVTNRRGFSSILRESLNRQTFRDFEVIIAADHPAEIAYLDGWTIFTPRQKKNQDVWNVNKAYNDCLDKARGELLVFLQDFIRIPDDGLERFWRHYEERPNALVCGVGHKAKTGITGLSEYDHRIDSVMPPTYTFWELNWASCPKKIMPRFNEDMDRYYGGENQYVAKLAMHRGASIILDKQNQCIAYSQAECGGRPENWESLHANKEGRLAAFLEFLERTEPPLDASRR